jgi:vitamin B12 transporter
MTIKSKPLAMSIAIAAIFSSVTIPAFAQDSSNSTFDSNFNSASQDVIITASRLPQVAKDVLADNVVITAEEIRKSGAISIVDLLQQQRGIEIGRNGGVGSVSSLFMRGGNNTQNVVLIDGVRVGSSTTGGATWAMIPLAQIERIEIVYGPLSSLYGADAMNGVIQIFTKNASASKVAFMGGNANVGVGSFGLFTLGAGLAGANGEGLSYSVNVARDKQDGFSASKPGAGPYTYNVDKDGYELDSVSARLAYQIEKDTSIGVNVLHSKLNSQFDAGTTKDDRNIQKLTTASAFAQFKPMNNWSSRLQYAQTKDDGYTDASYGKSTFVTKQNTLSWQNDFQLDKNVLQLVAERREEKVENTTKALNGDRSTNSLAASYVAKFDQHLASASVRYDNSSQYGAKTNGSIAYGYRLTDEWRVNASYGTSFRAPTFNELYYPGFGVSSNKPEYSKNAEIGLYFDNNVVQWSAVYYSNKARDLLVSTNVCPVEKATHPYGCAYNVNRATMSGLTAGASVVLGDFTVRGTLDIQDPKDDTTGLRLARRSKQHASLAVEYQLPKTKLGLETVFSGQRFDDVANKRNLAGYALLNLYVSHDLGQNWSVLARWNNALNTKYELARNYNTPGSNGFVGVNYGFK